MPTTRSYQDRCGIARALDVVGERWALLVVRELLLGPQRFSELRLALRNTSANIVSARLRELTAHGVVHRRRLGPPSGSWVYELTERGRELEPILLALGGWGLAVPFPDPPAVLSPTSVLIYLRGSFRPDRSLPPVTLRIELDGQVWTARTDPTALAIAVGDTPDVDASVVSDPNTFNAVIGDPEALESGLVSGTVRAAGDLDALRRVLLSAG